jgi:hypothetical protein
MTTWLSNTVVDHLRVVATWPELPGDRYVIERPIGRGGMGTVYVARDTLLERDVAIKVSNAPVAGSGLDERLRQEAQVLARLEHPGIVPVHDAGRLADGRMFYVMKLVHGETLFRAREAPARRGGGARRLRARHRNDRVRARSGRDSPGSQAVECHDRPLRRGAGT